MEISLDQGRLETGGDIVVRCPRCKQNAEFTVSRKNMAGEKTKCPFCGEEILSTAIKCKHCREWVARAQGNGSSAARAVSRGIKQKNFSLMAFKSKLLLLFVGFVLAVNFIYRTFLYHFHEPITSPKYDWLLPYILIPILVVCLIIALKFLGQYYDE
jgi:phage FluMu protein Com